MAPEVPYVAIVGFSVRKLEDGGGFVGSAIRNDGASVGVDPLVTELDSMFVALSRVTGNSGHIFSDCKSRTCSRSRSRSNVLDLISTLARDAMAVVAACSVNIRLLHCDGAFCHEQLGPTRS